ncbi:MAG: hypothetical protein ACYS0K_11645 [Planctomycetota bacterium]|jgi:hypothetical protein
MLGGSRRSVPTGGTFWIVVLALIFVVAIAFAIPPAPFDIDRNVERGILVGHSRFSEKLAEQLVNDGYTYLAIELTQARLEHGDDTFWRRHFQNVDRRRLPIWGWVDVSQGPEHARNVVHKVNQVGLKLAGLFVAGRDAVQVARELRGDTRNGFRIVPVVRLGAVQPQEGEFAVALTGKDFVANQGRFDLPVLIADRLDATAIRAAREAADGHYLVAGVAIPE